MVSALSPREEWEYSESCKAVMELIQSLDVGVGCGHAHVLWIKSSTPEQTFALKSPLALVYAKFCTTANT